MINPMLLKRIEIKDIDSINSNDYLIYEKFDGFRCVFFDEKIIGRNNEMFYRYFPEILQELNLNYKNCIFDGELINSFGVTKSNIIQQRLTTNKFMMSLMNGTHNKLIPATLPATFMVFDILQKDGIDLKNLTFIERQKILNDTIKETDRIKIVKPMLDMTIKQAFDSIIARKGEGCVLKHKNSIYQEGERNLMWIKIKGYDETTLKATKYEITNSGLVLLSDNHRITCNGEQSKAVKTEIDTKGYCFFKIGFLEQNDSGMFRQPIFAGQVSE